MLLKVDSIIREKQWIVNTLVRRPHTYRARRVTIDGFRHCAPSTADLTSQESAGELGYHITYLYRLLKNGTLQAQLLNRVWMIDRQEVELIKSPQGPGRRLPKRVPEQYGFC